MDIAQTRVTSFGCGIGRWLVRCYTCHLQSAGPQLRTTVQSGHREGTRRTQLRQQSKLLLQRIKHACDGRSLAVLLCLQVVSFVSFTRCESDVGTLHVFCHGEYRLVPSCFAHFAESKTFLTMACFGEGCALPWPWYFVDLETCVFGKQIVPLLVMTNLFRQF